jgi:DNA-binding CsgD family transcriptional regulator
MAPETQKNKRGSTTDRSADTTADLIRLLVRLSATQAIAQDVYTNRSEEIILEADLDGAHYILIRQPNSNRPRVQLSPRELEIVRMVADGHSNKIIAKVLSISSWTVCTHLRRIFAKLGVSSRAAMVAQLLELWGAKEHAYQLLSASPHGGCSDLLEAPSKNRKKEIADQEALNDA